jgi:hypothetical protein
MTTDDRDAPTLEDNPGLEHDSATPEGELMTAAGSKISDPHEPEHGVTLESNPGLEHDEATEAGQMMTGEGSTGSAEDDEHYD